jgi:hypothetical protein
MQSHDGLKVPIHPACAGVTYLIEEQSLRAAPGLYSGHVMGVLPPGVGVGGSLCELHSLTTLLV